MYRLIEYVIVSDVSKYSEPLQDWLYSTSGPSIKAYNASPQSRLFDIAETLFFLLIIETEAAVSTYASTKHVIYDSILKCVYFGYNIRDI